LAAGLCRDPLRELIALHRLLNWLQMVGTPREGKRGETRGGKIKGGR